MAFLEFYNNWQNKTGLSQKLLNNREGWDISQHITRGQYYYHTKVKDITKKIKTKLQVTSLHQHKH